MRTKTPDPSTVRSTVIRLRVTEAEVELFKRKAREAGCKSVSEYIRLKCIDGIGTMMKNHGKRQINPRPSESKNLAEYFGEVRKVSFMPRQQYRAGRL